MHIKEKKKTKQQKIKSVMRMDFEFFQQVGLKYISIFCFTNLQNITYVNYILCRFKTKQQKYKVRFLYLQIPKINHQKYYHPKYLESEYNTKQTAIILIKCKTKDKPLVLEHQHQTFVDTLIFSFFAL